MDPCLTNQEKDETLFSLKKFFAEDFDMDLSDLRCRLLLDYILEEIAPFAYNQGVKDAEAFFRQRLEDLPGTCFEHPLSYWQNRRK